MRYWLMAFHLGWKEGGHQTVHAKLEPVCQINSRFKYVLEKFLADQTGIKL